MNTFYGLANKNQVIDYAHRVCDAIGHGVKKRAVALLVETCATETHLGAARDNTLYGAGAGLPQVDEGTFDWLKSEYQNSSIAKRVKEKLGIDISNVEYRELDFSPMIALVFCRLRYWKVVEVIPATIEERAQYWKTHYNTYAKNAKGSPEEYLARCAACEVHLMDLEVK